MIRPTQPEETPHLVAMTEATGLFKPMEVVALKEVLDDYHAEEHKLGHRCVSYEKDGTVLGFAYYAPAAMTDRSWYLYWIVVGKDLQAKGIGTELLRSLEHDIKVHHGRLLFIETGSVPHYEKTRQFYIKNGYEKHAVLKDFYADGDSMVVFRKAL
ncbi:MAG: GNAT family N-acetyltransferase [Planctomycetes bacterium]|nr:GNAT family N-acetyltransferase [Planctomycetota bacterium]